MAKSCSHKDALSPFALQRPKHASNRVSCILHFCRNFFTIDNFANSKFWDCSELVNTNQYWMMELALILTYILLNQMFSMHFQWYCTIVLLRFYKSSCLRSICVKVFYLYTQSKNYFVCLSDSSKQIYTFWILKWSDTLGFRNRAVVNKLLLGMKCSQVGFKLRREGVCLKKEYLMIWAQGLREFWPESSCIFLQK